MPQTPSIVTYHGARFTPVFRDAVAEWHRLATAENIPFTITQGGHNKGGVAASAGTHDGDAIDLSVRGLTQQQTARLIELGRMIGMAAWFRTKHAQWGTPAHGFGVAHIHAVPNGWGHPSLGAVTQAIAYRRGRDGLAGNRFDAGPGHTGAYRERTWQGYLNTTRRGVDLMERITGMYKNKEEFEKALRDNAEIGANRALWTPAMPARKGKDEWGNTPKDLFARTAYRLGEVLKRQSQILTRLTALEKKVK